MKRSHSDRIARIRLRKAATAGLVTRSRCSVRMWLVIANADFNISPQLHLVLLDGSDTLTVPKVERNAKTVGNSRKRKSCYESWEEICENSSTMFSWKVRKGLLRHTELYVCTFVCISALYHDQFSYFALLITHIHIQAFRKLFVTDGVLLCVLGALSHPSKSSCPFINTKKQGSDPQPSDWLETHTVSWAKDAHKAFLKYTYYSLQYREFAFH